jgi:four helix bundle protein
MTQNEMKARTKKFALRVIKLVDSLPNDLAASTIGKQLLRSGTSVGANYRSVCRAKSNADFISKLSIVEEEADESIYWMELLSDSKIIPHALLSDLINEADQIVAIIVKSIKTSKLRRAPKPNPSDLESGSVNPKSGLSNPKSAFPNPKSVWRKEWDSNPRYPFEVHSISSAASSTTPAPFRICFRVRDSSR